MLNILYVLLALSVIVAVFGIINTLVLSVFERTREIGMLRAVGTTRWQVRTMITLESIVTSLMGAAIGITLGVVLAALLIARVDFLILAWPIGSLLVFAIAAIIVGVIAAVIPARRAAKLNVLEALQYEWHEQRRVTEGDAALLDAGALRPELPPNRRARRRARRGRRDGARPQPAVRDDGGGSGARAGRRRGR